MSAQRLFVSLELPPSVTAALVRLDPGLRGVRWLRAEQIHLTLAFLGQVDSVAKEKLCAGLRVIHFNTFFLPLSGIGTFPGRGRPNVIWIGVGSGHPHLFQLHQRVIDAALGAGVEADLRPWHPHVTLARCQDVSAESLRPFLRAQADFDAGLVPIDALQMKSSQLTPAGSVYRTELMVRA